MSLPVTHQVAVRQAAQRHQPKRRSSSWRATTTQFGGALHSAFSGLSAVGADRLFAGVAFNEMRRPGTQRTFNTLGLKTFLHHSPRLGSRSSPRVRVCLTISPFHSPRTEPF
jgi:hypothetical protein